MAPGFAGLRLRFWSILTFCYAESVGLPLARQSDKLTGATMAERFNPEGKVALITGGAGGIGFALARRFGAAGCRVALLDVDEVGLAERSAALAEAGVEHLVRRCDVTDRADVGAAVTEVCSRFGGVDLLFNNAGMSHRSAFRDTAAVVYERVIAVNLFGSLYCAQAALPSLLRRKGMIVVTSSIAGFAPLLGRTGYCASKYALHGLFETARAELIGTGVSVLMVCPSFVDTNIVANALDASGNRTERPRVEMGKAASPDYVAERILAAVVRRKRFLVLSGTGRGALLLSRLAPGVYERFIRHRFANEL